MIDHLLSLGAVVLSLAGLALGFRKHGASRSQAREDAHIALGKKYAGMAWAYARAQKDSTDAAKARKHAVDSFALIDRSEDGRTDFTATEVAFYVDSHE